MTAPRVLIAGIGNIFLGDDAFGCEVARRLLERSWPAGVTIVDYGIRGLDLAYALLDGWDAAILLDVTPQGRPPGTLSVLELSLDDAGAPAESLDAHTLHPLNVLRLVRGLGGTQARLLLVGCEPADLGEETDGRLGLSSPVAAAVERAIPLVAELVAECFGVAESVARHA